MKPHSLPHNILEMVLHYMCQYFGWAVGTLDLVWSSINLQQQIKFYDLKTAYYCVAEDK